MTFEQLVKNLYAILSVVMFGFALTVVPFVLAITWLVATAGTVVVVLGGDDDTDLG